MKFRVATLNANGIRSATMKGLAGWIARTSPDVLCIQEVRASDADVPKELFDLGYEVHLCAAEKKGYSGVGVWSRIPVKKVVRHLPGETEFDAEGRYIEVDLGELRVASAYFPSGTSGDERQQAKYRFLSHMQAHLKKQAKAKKPMLVCGDVNIAHKEIDLKNWKGNKKNSGFLPDEREWMTELFETHGYRDVFRALCTKPDMYTWWSNRGQARAKNVGWRIDYHLAPPALASKAVHTEIHANERLSDHAPLIVDYAL